MALLAGCGDGIPKDKDDDKPPPAPTAALSVFAGDPTADGTMDGTGTAARFNNPHGLAIDSRAMCTWRIAATTSSARSHRTVW